MLTDNDLYGWQCRLANRIKAVCKVTVSKGVLVFVDMGQGKTAPSLTAIKDVMELMLVDCVLVIAPIRICEAVWRQEAKKWKHTRKLTFSLVRGNPSDRAFALNRKADVYLINPEHLAWLYTHLRGDFKRFQLVFVDESSLFKNYRSKRFKFIKKIKDNHMESIAFVPMTGTPLPHSIMDIWTQAYLVDGGERLGATFGQFRSRFFKPGRKLADHVYEWQPEDATSFDRIKALVADITIELSDSDRQKFPVVPVEHWVTLPTDIRAKYDLLEQKMIFEWNESKTIAKHGGAKSIMLRQIAAGAMYKNRLLNTDYDEMHSLKFDLLQELLEELNRPVLITYEFKHDLIRLKSRLEKFAVMAEGDASKNIRMFNDGTISNLLIHPASAAHGLDGLQHTGNTVIFLNEIWSQERHDQLIARLARNGQKDAQVFSHYIRARDTVESLMEISRRLKGDEQTRFRTALRIYQNEKGLL